MGVWNDETMKNAGVSGFAFCTRKIERQRAAYYCGHRNSWTLDIVEWRADDVVPVAGSLEYSGRHSPTWPCKCGPLICRSATSSPLDVVDLFSTKQ